ncbi:MAG: CDP-diacylglycerol--glycerol-3-phosphate 3-phosphatidyltransferase [Clostridia bacterium]
MNWPNRLSLLRIALVPVLVLLIYADMAWTQVLALIVFMGACFTDWLDGHIARKNLIVTNFGKFIDPVADKLLVLSTMIALCGQGEIPAWACIVVLFRELAVDGLRLVAVQQGQVIAAGKLGKIKTALQMLTLVLYLLRGLGDFMKPISEICLYLAVCMTLWSGVDYFVRNRAVFALGGGGKHGA